MGGWDSRPIGISFSEPVRAEVRQASGKVSCGDMLTSQRALLIGLTLMFIQQSHWLHPKAAHDTTGMDPKALICFFFDCEDRSYHVLNAGFNCCRDGCKCFRVSQSRNWKKCREHSKIAAGAAVAVAVATSESCKNWTRKEHFEKAKRRLTRTRQRQENARRLGAP